MSIGTFYALKLFYVRHASPKEALVRCVHQQQPQQQLQQKQQQMQHQQHQPQIFPINSYDEFFDFLYTDCENGVNTYLLWELTPCKDVSNLKNSQAMVTVMVTLI